jgi:hypothetical protein
MEHDVRAANAGAEFLDHIRPTVTVRVAQRKNLAVKPLGIDVAVRRDGQAAEIFLRPTNAFAGDKIIGVNQGPETGRKDDAPIVGVGRWQSSKNGCRENAQASDDYGDCSHF